MSRTNLRVCPRCGGTGNIWTPVDSPEYMVFTCWRCEHTVESPECYELPFDSGTNRPTKEV